MSDREAVQTELAEWISYTGRFTAPYGVLTGLHALGKGFVRSITFGVARISDIHLEIVTPKKFILRDSRYGTHEFTTTEEVKEFLTKHYRK